MDLEFELYKGKKFSSLLKDIVVNSEDRNDTMEKLIDDLRSMVKTANDAIIIVPLIADYLNITVKNDEQLVKLAAIVQRILSNKSDSGEDGSIGLSDEDKKQLMQEINNVAANISSPVKPKSDE